MQRVTCPHPQASDFSGAEARIGSHLGIEGPLPRPRVVQVGKGRKPFLDLLHLGYPDLGLGSRLRPATWASAEARRSRTPTT